MQKIGNFLKMLRKEKGLTQEQLAEYYDVEVKENIVILMANAGVWEVSAGKKRSPLNDCVLSVVIAAVFSVLYGLTIYRISPDGSKAAMFSALFFIGITALSFIVLRVLAAWSKMKKEKKKPDKKECRY